MKKLNKKGFTIVELALLVVIIGTVTGVGLYVKQRVQKTAEAGSYLTLGTRGKMTVSACRATRNGHQQLRVRVRGARDANVRSQRVTNITFQGASIGQFFPSLTGTTQKELSARYPASSPNFSVRLAWQDKQVRHIPPSTNVNGVFRPGSTQVTWKDTTYSWIPAYNSLTNC